MKIHLFTALPLVFILTYAESKEKNECPELVLSEGYYTTTFNKTCYLFVNKEVYWGEAYSYCLELGGDLISITNQATMNFIKEELNDPKAGHRWKNRGVWIGARYYKDSWIWSTGEKVRYSNWASGEPSKFLGLISFENCGVMRREDDWQWHDYHCNSFRFHYKYICQFPTVPEPTTKVVMTTSRPTSLLIPTGLHVEIVEHGHDKNVDPQQLRAYHPVSSGTGQNPGHKPPGITEDNGNTMILVLVISLAVLLIIAMFIIFFIVKRRQHKKHSQEVPPVRYDSHFAQAGRSGNENAERRPASNIYFDPTEVNALYEEVNKEVNHGVNAYSKNNNCLQGHVQPLPLGLDAEEGACGGEPPEEIAVNDPLMGASAFSLGEESGEKGGNAYVEMNGNKPSNLYLTPVAMSKSEESTKTPVYTNTVALKGDPENPYEDLL